MALGQNRTCKVFGTKADSTSDKYPYMELRLINLHDVDDDDHNDEMMMHDSKVKA